MAERDRAHIIVPASPSSESFTIVGSGRASDRAPFVGDRRAHGQRLIKEAEAAVASSPDEREATGVYITFDSFPGLELAIKSLESHGKGQQPELVAVQEEQTADGPVTRATVFVPNGKKEYLFKKLEEYLATVEGTKGKPRHAQLVEGIASIRRATIRDLWTDPLDEFPTDRSRLHWWEVLA